MKAQKQIISTLFSSAFPFGLDLAAINIQRGRDHGLPSYTQWREPCGLSPINDWDDLERVVGPQSAERIRLGYRSVHDIDLFVGGLAERPVVGGLVGPVFACIIAQQFSNLRKGDRFWYENGGFESSFTPAQLQSIRQVSFAQIVCRTIGGGTLQPHIFLPHTVSTNERIPCDTGSLVPIDLKPWMERDPFIKDRQHDARPIKNMTSANSDNTNVRGTSFPIIIPIEHTGANADKATVFRNQYVGHPLVMNGAFVDNKLDLKRPVDRVNDKINMPTKTKRKKQRRPGHNTPKTATTTRPTRRMTTTKKRHKLRKYKRDVSQNDKARGAIYIKIDRPTSDKYTTKRTPFSSTRPNEQHKSDKMTTDKEYIILTPDQTTYDIEIKIKPNTKRTQTIQKIVTVPQPSNGYFGTFQDDGDEQTTNRPQHFYNTPQPSLANDNPYNGGGARPQQMHNDVTSRPNFHGIITKKTTIAYGTSFDDEVTMRPYFPIKRPTQNHGTAHDDDNHRPFYNYPTVQQIDQSTYYATQGDSTDQQDEYATSIIQNTNAMKPYHSVPLYQTNTANRPYKRPTFNDDKPQKPTYSYRPPLLTDSGYANRPLSDTNYASGPIYLDDFETTPLPVRLTTTYSYANTIKLQIPNAGYYPPTTNRPHDLMTFYTVMTTKKRKRTKPTKPITYNQQDEDDDDDDDDDNNSDDDDESDDTTWNPTAVISNIVNTFSDYFGSSPTSTRRPYVQSDNDEDDFYAFPSFPQQSFLYSRQKDGQTVDTNVSQKETNRSTVTTTLNTTATNLNRRIDTVDTIESDYDTNTYRAVHNEQYNADQIDDDQSIAFDRDGYLRPEYMKYEDLKNMKATNNDMTQPVKPETILRRPKQMTFSSSASMNRPSQISNPSGLVPLNVLTKPER